MMEEVCRIKGTTHHRGKEGKLRGAGGDKILRLENKTKHANGKQWSELNIKEYIRTQKVIEKENQMAGIRNSFKRERN